MFGRATIGLGIGPHLILGVSILTAYRTGTGGFYSARNARIASAVLATAIPSVCLSVRLSVRPSHAVLCQNDGT